MKILVTGRDGQVARSLAEHAAGMEFELAFVARPELDLANSASIERAIEATRPDLIVSAAAYTQVDKAEDEPDLAMAVNGVAPGVIGTTAARIGVPIIHLSTDYVFDGKLDRAYRENDPTGPLGVYGRTKLAGEQALSASGARYAILRTAWVYSPFGGNFAKTMLRLATGRESLSIVDDQQGCPTSAFDIADAILRIAGLWRETPQHGADAIYHLAGGGSTNWADLAREIFRRSAALGGPSAEVVGIPSADYPTKAVRPANSRLDGSRLLEVFGIRLPDWRASLATVVERILRESAAG